MNPIVYGAAVAYTPEFVSFDNVAAIHRADGVEALVRCVKEGSRTQKEHAASALSNLATTSDQRSDIARAGAIQPLLTLVSASGPGQAIASRHAVMALGSLAFNHPVNQAAIRSLGGEKVLMQLARGEEAPEALRKAAEYAVRNLSSVSQAQAAAAAAGPT